MVGRMVIIMVEHKSNAGDKRHQCIYENERGKIGRGNIDIDMGEIDG